MGEKLALEEFCKENPNFEFETGKISQLLENLLLLKYDQKYSFNYRSIRAGWIISSWNSSWKKISSCRVDKKIKSHWKKRIDHLRGNEMFKLKYGDMTDSSSISSILSKYKPTEIYNLAAQSHVQVSFTTPEYTAESDGIGAKFAWIVRSLEIKTKIYQASTSELYGDVTDGLAQTKILHSILFLLMQLLNYMHLTLQKYTEMHIRCISQMEFYLIMNHKKRWKFCIKKNQCRCCRFIMELRKISLGNLNSMRDWGHARITAILYGG